MKEPPTTSREDRLNQVLAAYVSARDSGRPIDRGVLLAEHPDLADELASFFADYDDVAQIAGVDRAAETMPPTDAAAPRPTPDEPTPRVPSSSAAGREPARRGGSPLAANPPLRTFGDFDLLEEIARGGMGVVYKARQRSLNRTVAVKMILAGQFARPDDVMRFRVEAEAAAQLQHHGIVAIHEVGEIDGQHYFAMDFVDGPSLAALMREHPLPPNAAAAIVRAVAEATHYAHQKGIVHRDLKPSNILLQGSGPGANGPGTQARSESEGRTRSPFAGVSGLSALSLEPRTLTAKITDFGLAKRIEHGSDLTGTGQVIGTPSYMSPEQAGGEHDRVGAASDVYSIGAVLYEALTGRPPFRASTPMDTVLQVLDAEPAAPRTLNASVPRDLETICLKCLAKQPAQRYATAQDLADDLGRFLRDEPIAARHSSIIEGLARALWRSRHERELSNWGAALIALGVVIGLAHVASYLLHRGGFTWPIADACPRAAMSALLLVLFVHFRPQSLLPTNAAERLIWAVWIGYLVAYSSVSAAYYLTGRPHLETYSAAAALSGLGFFVLGAHVWGWLYLAGIGFMLLTPLLARYPATSPLWFGLMWGVTLFVTGLRYRGPSRPMV